MLMATESDKESEMSFNQRFTLEEGIALIQKELTDGKEAPTNEPKELPLKTIRMAQSVFQPRDFSEAGVAYSEDHIRNLLEAISANPQVMLDPLVVWWSGKHWRVIDGHHRLLAYERWNKQRPNSLGNIPVKVFKGSLEDAMLEAARQNSKDKLPMSKTEKLNRAWKFTHSGIGSKKTISEACKVSPATVSNMRKQLEAIKAWSPAHWEAWCAKSTWETAKKFGQEEREISDGWKEKLAKKWTDRLGVAFGTKFAQQPEIAARALEMYSEKLVDALCEEWHDIFKDRLEQLEEDPLDHLPKNTGEPDNEDF